MRGLNGSLRALLSAWLLARCGTWAFTVALAVHAYQAAGPGAVGVVAAARMLPAALVAPLAGRMADRRDRSGLATLATLAQACSLAVLAAAMAAGASMSAVAALAAAAGAAATPTRPALQTLTPALARSPEELARATGLWTGLESLGFLAGSGIGGVAVGAAGPAAVVAAAAVVLALAAGLCARLPHVAAVPPPGAEAQGGLEDALAGVRVLRRGGALRTPFLLLTGVIVVKGAVDVAVVILALQEFQVTSGPGLLFAAWGAGGLTAGWLLLALMRRRGYGLAIAAGGIAVAIGLLVSAQGGLTIGMLAMVVAGAGYALVTAGAAALVPRLADDAVVGRVYALCEVVYGAAAAAGALLAPVLSALLGVRGSLVALGLVFGACTAVSLHALRRLDEAQEVASRVRSRLRAVSFLHPLPLPLLERLVQRAEQVDLRAGSEIFRRGDAGNAFYVVDSGTVHVVDHARHLVPGSGFGEIALLRDVPRTSTVRAETDVRLWALGRGAFVAAVTEHGEARRAADAAVTELVGPSPVSA